MACSGKLSHGEILPTEDVKDRAVEQTLQMVLLPKRLARAAAGAEIHVSRYETSKWFCARERSLQMIAFLREWA